MKITQKTIIEYWVRHHRMPRDLAERAMRLHDLEDVLYFYECGKLTGRLQKLQRELAR